MRTGPPKAATVSDCGCGELSPQKWCYFTSFGWNGSGFRELFAALEWRTEEVGEGRHVDFVVYAGVRSGGLAECGSRGGGKRGAGAAAAGEIRNRGGTAHG